MKLNENQVKKTEQGVQVPDLKKRPMPRAAGMNGGMPAICGKLPVNVRFEAAKQCVVAVSGEVRGS